MNIFALSNDPEEAARWHVDRHVVKMPVESAQMMSSAVRLAFSEDDLRHMKKRGIRLIGDSNPNHPSTKWVRESVLNFMWLRHLALALVAEHRYRYGLHRVEMETLIREMPVPPLSSIGRTPFYMAMPEWIKSAGLDPVIAYRVYYANDKMNLFNWKRRNIPPWLPDSVLPPRLRAMPRGKIHEGITPKIRI